MLSKNKKLAIDPATNLSRSLATTYKGKKIIGAVVNNLDGNERDVPTSKGSVKVHWPSRDGLFYVAVESDSLGNKTPYFFQTSSSSGLFNYATSAKFAVTGIGGK